MDKLNELETLAKAVVKNVQCRSYPIEQFLDAATPESILAIAQAFRELEKERNAFESNYDGEIDLRKQTENNWDRLAAASGWVDSRDQYAADNDLPRQFDSATEMAKSWKRRAEAAEAQLAELAKQKPVAYTDAEELETMRKGTFADMFTPCDEYKSDLLWIPLFTRPAPAAVPLDLVPDLIKPEDVKGILDPTANPDEYACCVGSDMWNACCAEVLRRIERLNHDK